MMEKEKFNGGRIVLAVVMILLAVFCGISLTQGFTIWVLLLTVGFLVLGVFNLMRGLAIKRQKKSEKSSEEGTGSGFTL